MTVTNTLGYLLLLHAAYSSYEHHHTLKLSSTLPTEIILELVIGLMVVNFGTLGQLQYPRSAVLETGMMLENEHTYLKPIEMSRAMVAVNKLGVSEYEYLDTRVELMDVRKKREEYARWTNGET